MITARIVFRRVIAWHDAGIMAKSTSPEVARSSASTVSYDRPLVAAQLAKVRALCHALPEVTERPSHGSPAFLVHDKRCFAYFLDNHHGDGRLALWCAAPEGAQAMLVDSNPDHYFLPPYVARSGWIGVRLDRGTPWNEIAMVLENAHQTRYKPARQRKAGTARKGATKRNASAKRNAPAQRELAAQRVGSAQRKASAQRDVSGQRN